jgi:putative sigma-54 modulation protein
MHLVIKGLDRNGSAAVREFVKRRVTSKLSRVSKRIRSVQIWIRDINGPRGGKDHLIQFLVQMRPTGTVVIRHRDYGPYTGLPVALQRAIHAVKRALGRRRSNRIDSFRRNLHDSAMRGKRRGQSLKPGSCNEPSTNA